MITLSQRRQQMADEIDRNHNDRASEFDYRRRITDDIEKILREAEVFNIPGESSPADRYEQSALLRRLAEDITTYITR